MTSPDDKNIQAFGGGPWGDRPQNRPQGNGTKSPWGRPDDDKGGDSPFGGSEGPRIDDVLNEMKGRIRGIFGGGGGGRRDGEGGSPRFGGRSIGFAIIVTVLIWLATGFYTVRPNQQGVELVFGKVYDTTGPGLQYNFPTPLGTVLLPSVTSINQEQIGFRDVSITGGNIGKRKVTEESLMLTGDENIIEVEFVVFWKIRDAGKYLFNLRNQSEGVKGASEAAMREIIGKTNFEYARTAGRNDLSLQAKELIQRILDSYSAGIEVVRVNLQSVDPPATVLDAFRDVQAARADKERAINEATAYANEVVQRAQGQAEQVTQSAEAYKEEQIAEANGNAERFLSIYAQYKENPNITKRRIYLQSMEEILGNMDKILIEENVGGSGGVVPYLPLDQLRNRASNTDSEN